MNGIYALLLASSTLTVSEKSVVATFSKLKSVHEKFLTDTLQHRDELESFHENEFLPAVEAMISLLAKGQCKACLGAYIKALAYQKESADETIGEQLSKIIEAYPTQMNKVCKKMPAKELEDINSWLLDAVDHLAYSKGRKIAETYLGKITSCLSTKRGR